MCNNGWSQQSGVSFPWPTIYRNSRTSKHINSYVGKFGVPGLANDLCM
jgi:hypothetical protein